MQEQNQRTSPWLIAWRVIFTFALIGCIVFIFSNSLQIADVSEGASGRVLGILQGILRHLGLPGAADRLTMHIVRKLAHFCEYLLEGFLLMLCLRVYTRHFFKHVSWPMLGGLLTALTDETIQLFVPGRSGQVTDIWIDFSGVMTDCDEGCLEWVDKAAVQDLPIWQGDKIFFKLLAEDAPFFHLELTYDGDVLVKAVLDGVSLAL